MITMAHFPYNPLRKGLLSVILPFIAYAVEGEPLMREFGTLSWIRDGDERSSYSNAGFYIMWVTHCSLRCVEGSDHLSLTIASCWWFCLILLVIWSVHTVFPRQWIHTVLNRLDCASLHLLGCCIQFCYVINPVRFEWWIVLLVQSDGMIWSYTANSKQINHKSLHSFDPSHTRVNGYEMYSSHSQLHRFIFHKSPFQFICSVRNSHVFWGWCFLNYCRDTIDIQRLGRKQMDHLASMQNDTATSVSSAYGKKLLEKMGWNEWLIVWGE